MLGLVTALATTLALGPITATRAHAVAAVSITPVLGVSWAPPANDGGAAVLAADEQESLQAPGLRLRTNLPFVVFEERTWTESGPRVLYTVVSARF